MNNEEFEEYFHESPGRLPTLNLPSYRKLSGVLLVCAALSGLLWMVLR